MTTDVYTGAAPSAARAEDGIIGLAERGWLPDAMVRFGIRRYCRQRLREEAQGGPEAQSARFARRLDALASGAIALHVDAANRQHYELPPAFFETCLGPRLKYSCCYFPTGRETLGEAEEAMLRLYAERADLCDGQAILELGCGWGSLTLWMAERFPRSQIVAVSNSALQREFIERACRTRGIANVEVLTQDVNHLELGGMTFDRCISIEMFEHMRNYGHLLERIAGLLRPGGKLFVHIFAHRRFQYPFETEGQDNWMGRHFFTGGQMPSVETLLRFQEHLRVKALWLIDGSHYQRTADLWLARQDAGRQQALAALAPVHGASAELWCQRWRIFWMACAELFGFEQGKEWLVAHYLFHRADEPVRQLHGGLA